MKAFFTKSLLSFTTVLLIIANIFLSIFDLPKYPTSDLDMTKFEETPVFADEFDGTQLNSDIWNGHFTKDGTYSVRRGGYWHRDMVSVEDGNLHIKTAYLDDGLAGGPAGWYSAGIDTNKRYEQTYGYFECRCILPKGIGHWSAFWLLTDSMSNVSDKGLNGAEIDVMESPFYFDKYRRNATLHTIHIDGYGDDHDSDNDGYWRISGDPYSEYHTYGVEWNEDGYTFYIDGKKTSHTDFGGASRVPEYMILSVEVDGENGIPAEGWSGPPITENEGGLSFASDFVVDYVRAYQYK